MLGLINSFLDGYDTISSFRKQTWARDKVSDSSRKVLCLANKAHRKNTNFTFITGVVNTLAVIFVWVVLIYGIDSVHNSDNGSYFSIGGAVIILFYFNMLTQPLELITSSAKALSKGLVSLTRISEFINGMNFHASQYVCPNDHVSDNESVFTGRNIRDMREGNPILNPCNIHLHGGDIIGIAGASGSGKSTLLKVMARMIPATGDEISYFGESSHSLDEADFRKLVSYFPQSSNIFPVTLEENFFLSGKTELIMNYKKFMVEVGMRDKWVDLIKSMNVCDLNLSGGEGQRIAFSRFYGKTARLLILDEPTSSLDKENSLRIRDVLIDFVSDGSKSVVVSSHDPIILKCCTKIYLLDKGCFIDKGNMKSLSENSELFQSIISSK